MMEEHQRQSSQDGNCQEDEIIAVCINEDFLSIKGQCIDPTVYTSPCITEQDHSPHTVNYIEGSVKKEPDLCKELSPSNLGKPIFQKKPLVHAKQTVHIQNSSACANQELSHDDGTLSDLIDKDPNSNATIPNCDSVTDHSSVTEEDSANIMNEIEVIYQNPPNSTFGDIANLTRYSRAHSKRKIPQCLVCGKYFLRKAQLAAHEVIHPEQFTVSCPKCGQDFSSTAELLAHKKMHRPETVFLCLECGRCFRGRGQLVMHQKRHLREKTLLST